MADPHNPKRYGETWSEDKVLACLTELETLKQYITISGGWAWHFMSPIGHKELKHAHDHKDIDIFVKPENVVLVLRMLDHHGFKKVYTRFDKLPNNKDFRRYVKDDIIIDFFVEDVPTTNIDGWNIIEVNYLLSLYKNVHSSDNCFAVKAASYLMKKGISPTHREELTQESKEYE